MTLKSFKEMNKKEKITLIGIVVIMFLVMMLVVYRSYAIYQGTDNFNVIKGDVPDYMSDYDVRLTLTIDGVYIQEFPNRDSGKVFMNSECDKGAIGVWDYDSWGPKVLNVTKTRTKCKYHFVSKYSDSVLNGTDPVLKDGLIPVTIDDSGVVRKANESSEWYNYGNKKWANAVILEDKNVVYSNGEVIPEDNIESYFVWIPRYRYKIFNDGNYEGLTSVVNGVKAIEVEFENKDQPVSTGSKVGEWLTHPAFVSFNVNGMWVGKFETGYKGATSTEEAEINGGYGSKVQIKPNVYSWRSIKPANAFVASYDYQREMDSHMMKNTEWGAVAYLSHSVYGNRSSIRINNNKSFITGYAAINEPTCGIIEPNQDCNRYESTELGVDGTYTMNYKNPASVVASTTGNYSGVYDMSGGTFEYVMGVMMDQNGNMVSGQNDRFKSGFIGILSHPGSGTDTTKTTWTVEDGGIPFPNSKYYDKYAYNEDEGDYNRRILGDATGEMGPFDKVSTRQIGSWYTDEAWFINYANPWFVRGIYYLRGSGAGVFAFSNTTGSNYNHCGFRMVLAI